MLIREGRGGTAAPAERRMTFPPREVSDTFVCVDRERAREQRGEGSEGSRPGMGGSRKGGKWQDRTLDEANLGHKSCSGAGGKALSRVASSRAGQSQNICVVLLRLLSSRKRSTCTSVFLTMMMNFFSDKDVNIFS